MATLCLCFRDLELYFGSAAAAAAAAESLYQLRQGVEVESSQWCNTGNAELSSQ